MELVKLVTGFKFSQRFIVAVYSTPEFLQPVDVESVTSKTLHMEAAYTS
jgi:hypothetical protein